MEYIFANWGKLMWRRLHRKLSKQEESSKADEELIETAPVKIDSIGRLYVTGTDLARSKAFRSQLDEMAKLVKEHPSILPEASRET